MLLWLAIKFQEFLELSLSPGAYFLHYLPRLKMVKISHAQRGILKCNRIISGFENFGDVDGSFGLRKLIRFFSVYRLMLFYFLF